MGSFESFSEALAIFFKIFSIKLPRLNRLEIHEIKR